LGQGLRQQCALPLAAGQRRQAAPPDLGQTQPFHGLVDQGTVAAIEPVPGTADGPPAHGHGVPDGQREPIGHGAALHDERHPAGDPVDRAGGRRQHSGHQGQHGGLARSVRTQQRQELAGGDIQAQPVDHRPAPVPEGHRFEPDRPHWIRLHSHYR
jgi:hypothetical protein